MLDPAAADLVAVAVEKDYRKLGFFQPVVVGRLPECRNRKGEGHQQPAGAKGGEFGQGLHHQPAAPPRHVETIHEVAEPLEGLARHPAAAKQSGIEARVEIKQIGPEALPPAGSFIEWNLVLHDRSYGLLIRRCHGGAGIQLHKQFDPAGVSARLAVKWTTVATQPDLPVGKSLDRTRIGA